MTLHDDVRAFVRAFVRVWQDTVVCNNEKLSSGSTSEFIESCRQFLSSTVFKNGAAWPSVIFAPSNVGDRGPNHAVEVSCDRADGEGV